MLYLIRLIGISLLISLSVQGCENNSEDKIFSEVKTIDHGYYSNNEIQYALLEELDKTQIPYKVLKNGLVRVPTSSLAKYLNLKRKFHSNYFYQMDELDPNYHEQFDI